MGYHQHTRKYHQTVISTPEKFSVHWMEREGSVSSLLTFALTLWQQCTTFAMLMIPLAILNISQSQCAD